MTSKKKGELAATINFPLYGVEMLTDRHFVVAGGGGPSKTGVPNGFAIFQLTFNGEQCVASRIEDCDTGDVAIMNLACFEDRREKKLHLAIGLNDHCQLFSISKTFETERNHSNSIHAKATKINYKDLPIQRKSSRQKHPTNVDDKPCGFIDGKQDICRKLKMLPILRQSVKTIRTEYNVHHSTRDLLYSCLLFDSDDIPKYETYYQSTVRISPNGKLMACGGEDGKISLWSFPLLEVLQEFKAHNKGVNDIDFNLDSQKIVSVGGDGCAFVWRTKDGSQACSLELTLPRKAKYNYRRCRFSVGENENERPRLFTIANPTEKKLPSFLQLWDTSNFLPVKCVAKKSIASELAVSPCGKFVAVGFSSGGVEIFNSSNLQLIYRATNAHSNCVTGLVFAPCHTETGQAITGQSKCAAISVSFDNQIRVHRISNRSRLIPLWLAIIIIVSVTYFTFFFCRLIDL